MNISEKSEDQVDSATAEDPTQEADVTAKPMVERAAVSGIAVLDPG